MRFKVTLEYARNPERQIAAFETQEDAKTFIQAKIEKDAQLKVKAIYRLMKDFDVLEEFNSEDSGTSTARAPETTSGGQKSSAGFKPTPFDTSPRPAGMPKKWIVNGEDEDKK